MKTPNCFRALCLGALVLTTACADAPITAAQLQDDGQLRAGQSAPEGSVALFSAEAPTSTHQAQSIALSALLETQVDPESDDADAEREVSLRLLGEGLRGPLPVAIIWSHGDEQREQTAVVQPDEGLKIAASQEFLASDAGMWRVEVFALRAGDRDLMLAREFDL